MESFGAVYIGKIEFPKVSVRGIGFAHQGLFMALGIREAADVVEAEPDVADLDAVGDETFQITQVLLGQALGITHVVKAAFLYLRDVDHADTGRAEEERVEARRIVENVARLDEILVGLHAVEADRVVMENIIGIEPDRESDRNEKYQN